MYQKIEVMFMRTWRSIRRRWPQCGRCSSSYLLAETDWICWIKYYWRRRSSCGWFPDSYPADGQRSCFTCSCWLPVFVSFALCPGIFHADRKRTGSLPDGRISSVVARRPLTTERNSGRSTRSLSVLPVGSRCVCPGERGRFGLPVGSAARSLRRNLKCF